MGIVAAIPSTLCFACQTISCACSFITCCFQANKGISYTAAKLMYITMLGLSTLLAAILKFTGDDWHGSVGGTYQLSIGCKDKSDDKLGYDYGVFGASAHAHCAGDAAVYRIGFALSVFFAIMMALGAMGEGFMKGFWGFKLLFYGLAMLGCFFIPEEFFASGVFLGIARTGSAGFLILQVLILIDFGYQWNEDWVAKAFEGVASEYDEPTDKRWLMAILGSAIALYVAAVTGVVLLFVFFGNTCGISQAFISISLLLVVIATALTLFRSQLIGAEGAVLPSGVVTLYVIYLTWSALQSNPDEECKPFSFESASSITMGITFMALSLMWTSLRTSKGAESLLRTEVEAPALTSSLTVSVLESSNGGTLAQEEGASTAATTTADSSEIPPNDEPAPPAETITIFFFTLIMSALYMSMILTNWGEQNESGINQADTGNGPMWAKIISAWIACLLYIWTLVAPLVCEVVCRGSRVFN